MKKYWSLLRYEWKTMVKEPMNLFMLVYPFMMLFIMGFLVPSIIDRSGGAQSEGAGITLLICFIITLGIGGYIVGCLLGFSFLENKDEKTLLNIAVTPITIRGYATFKTIFTYVIAILSNLIMVGGIKLFASGSYVISYGGITIGLLDAISYGEIIILSLVNALLVPCVALLIAAFAKNKVEGFAYLKGGAMVIMVPVLALLTVMQDGKQYLLGLLPNFWPVKAILNETSISSNPANLPFAWYMIIGTVYSLVLAVLTYYIFTRRTDLK